MPRGKKPGHRAKAGRFPPRGRQFDTETSFVPFASSGTSSPRGGPGGLSLQQEAFNTERHHSFWSSDQRLRHSKIDFISAGRTDPIEPLEPPPKDTESAMAEMTLDSPPREETVIEVEIEEEVEDKEQGIQRVNSRPERDQLFFIDVVGDEPPPTGLPTPQTHSRPYQEQRAQPVNPMPEHDQLFFIDVVGDEPPPTGLPTPQAHTRPSSPTPSNSSEEIILFQGRNNKAEGDTEARRTPRVLTDPVDAMIAPNKVHRRDMFDTATSSEAISSKFPKESADSSSGEFDAILPKPRSRRGRHSRHDIEQEEEDALVADYIANMKGGEDSQGWNVPSPFSKRPLGGFETDSGSARQVNTKPPTERAGQSEPRLKLGGWDPSDICDFDELSTSDGVMGEIQAVLSKRNRRGGAQYLVVWAGQSVDEARWVPATTLIGAEAMLLIKDFEEEERLVAEYQGHDDEDSTDSGDVDTDDALDDEEDNEDEDDLLWQREVDHLADEQIARLLDKQEQLGMGSNELLLLDDAADADEDDDLPPPSSNYNPFLLSSQRSQAKARGLESTRGGFPAASELADAYDGFDVMDFERPSLKKKPKGRRGKLDFNLSDSDLEASVQATFENDRIKKKERKQHREALRAEGLLGSKNGKPNLKEKYREGMGIGAVKDEVKAFLLSNHTTLALPPMDKADRKVVHELANAFNLKSKSAGFGNKRFPVLYRTSRTLDYVERTFDAVEAKFSRRFLPRMDVGGKKASKASKGGRGGFGNATAGYRDGDVVGASAPELGVENRGRAMLEKMGWSTGTALGALNNKGILQPVSHVVKTTKAGLG